MIDFEKTLSGLLLATALGSSAFAGAGDVYCTGFTADGKRIEVSKTYESADHDTPQTINVSLAGKLIAAFKDAEVKSRYVNIGDIKKPSLNFQEHAESAIAKTSLSYPEQPLDRQLTANLMLDVPSQNVKFEDVRVLCR